MRATLDRMILIYTGTRQTILEDIAHDHQLGEHGKANWRMVLEPIFSDPDRGVLCEDGRHYQVSIAASPTVDSPRGQKPGGGR